MMSEGASSASPPMTAARRRPPVPTATSEVNSNNWAGESAGNGPLSPAQSQSSPTVTTATATAAAASAEARALLEFGEGYHRILEEIGNPGYYSIKALFYGEEGPPGNTIPSITVSFELFEAVQNRFATTKATLERTKEDLHTRHQQYALLEGQHEQLQGSYNLLESRANDLERKNTQLLQDIAKQGVMAELLRQQVTRMKSETEMIEEKMVKRDEELQVLHNRVAEGLVSLSQKETIIANLRRQLGYGGRLKRDGAAGNAGGEVDEYSPEALKRIADDVEGRSTEARLRLCVVELEAKVRRVVDEKKYIMLRHTKYRNHVQSVTESYEALCMSREDAMGSHVCEAPPCPSAVEKFSEEGAALNHDGSMRTPTPAASQYTLDLPDRVARDESPAVYGTEPELHRSHGRASETSITSKGDSGGLARGSYEGASSLKFAESETQPSRLPSKKNRPPVTSMQPLTLHGSQEDKVRASPSSDVTAASTASRAKEGARPRDSKAKRKLQSAVTGSLDNSSAHSPLHIQHGGSQGVRNSRDQSSRDDSATTTMATPLSKTKAKNKSAAVRDQGTQTEGHGGKRSTNGPHLQPNAASTGRHNTAGLYNPNLPSPSFSFMASAQSGELSPSWHSQSEKHQERGSGAAREASSSGPFGAMLPNFDQQLREQNEDSRHGSVPKGTSDDRARAGRKTQEKGESSERTRSSTNRVVRSLAEKYGDLHEALLSLDELFASSKGNEYQGGAKPVPFYLDENNADAATQAEYLSSVVAADTRVLLRILNRTQRMLSASGSLHSSPRRVVRDSHQTNPFGQSLETSLGHHDTSIGGPRTSKSPFTSPLDVQSADMAAAGNAAHPAAGLGRGSSRRLEAAGTSGGTERLSTPGRVNAADQPGAPLRAGSLGTSTSLERLGASRRATPAGNFSTPKTGELSGTGESASRRSGTDGRISASGGAVSQRPSRVSQSVNSASVSHADSPGPMPRKRREDGSNSFMNFSSRLSNNVHKGKGTKPTPTYLSRNDKRGAAERHLSQSSTGEKDLSAWRHGSSTYSPFSPTGASGVGRQGGPQTTSPTTKTTPFLPPPDVPVRGGDGGPRGQAVKQEGATVNADPAVGGDANVGAAVGGNAPTLPTLSARQRNTNERGADRGRHGPKRLPWNATVVRLDFSKLLNPKMGEHAPQYYQAGRQRSPHPLTSASPPNEALSRRALGGKVSPGRRQAPVYSGATPGFASNTDARAGLVNALLSPPPNALPTAPSWSLYRHPNPSIPSKNTAEQQFDGLSLGGIPLLTPSNPVPLQRMSRLHPPPGSRWPQDTALGARQAMYTGVTAPHSYMGQGQPNANYFTGFDPQPSDLHIYGSSAAPQLPIVGAVNGGDIQRQEPPFWSNFYSNEQVLVRMLYRDLTLWRLVRDGYGRACQPPRTFSRSWARRSLFRSRQLRYQRAQLRWLPLSRFNHRTFVPPLDLCVGAPGLFGMVSRVLGRRRYAKRVPRSTCLVKRALLSHQKPRRPRREFVPLLIRGLALTPPPNEG